MTAEERAPLDAPVDLEIVTPLEPGNWRPATTLVSARYMMPAAAKTVKNLKFWPTIC